jgi:benzodiazapine receptor
MAMMMKKSGWLPYVLFVLLTEAVGGFAGLLTRDGVMAYNAVVKPALTPPGIVFPIVWAILFALMGISAALIWKAPSSPERTRSLVIFALQLIVNFFWSPIFFNMMAFGFAFIWIMLLWVLILLMILAFRKVDKTAAWLQVPYFIWVTFAAYLNYAVWMLNK